MYGPQNQRSPYLPPRKFPISYGSACGGAYYQADCPGSTCAGGTSNGGAIEVFLWRGQSASRAARDVELTCVLVSTLVGVFPYIAEDDMVNLLASADAL